MHRMSLILSSSPRIGGEQLVAPVAEHCEAWPQAWLLSLGAFNHAGNASLSCGVSGQRGDSCSARRPLRLTGWSAEGCL